MSPRFPVSDHCDGERFFNPHGPAARSFLDLPRWWWQRLRGSAAPWPKSPPAPARPALSEAVRSGEAAVTLLGHATCLLQLPGLTVLTDPVFGSRAGPFGLLGPARVRPPALRLDELPRVDVVLLSHNHYDHLDLASLRWLSRHRQPRIFVPLGLKAWLEARGVDRVVELDWWQSHRLQPDAEILCTPAQHWSSRWPWDRCRTLWAGFWLRGPDGGVFFAGDTGWGPHFAEIRRRLGAPRLALLPIGAYEPRWFMEPVHMNPDEAVRAHLALGAVHSLGMHHGTFRLTDEGWDAPVRALAAAREKHGVPPAAFVAPEFGETAVLPLR
jgi:L-ascorbate metabolism protein UlaG (beta-lactamase superfamily)